MKKKVIGPGVAVSSKKASDMLETETKKMEEKLALVKKMMDMEKEKRSNLSVSNQGTLWRGASTKKDIRGFGNAVVNHHKKVQPNLPATNMVTNPDGNANQRKKLPSGTGKRVPSASGKAKAPQQQTLASKNFVGNLNAQPQSVPQQVEQPVEKPQD